MELEKKLIDTFFSSHPTEAIQALNDVDRHELSKLLESLDPQSAAISLQKVQAKTASFILGNMSSPAAAGILQQLPFDTQLVFMNALNVEKREQLLDVLTDTHSKKLRRLLDYPEGSAGKLMDPSPLSVVSDCLIKNALKQVQTEVDSAGYYIYVTDDKRCLVGVLTFQELFKADKQVSVASIMSTEIATISAMASERDIIKHPLWKDFHELPVVDRNQVFVGVIRYQTLCRLKASRSSDQTEHGSLATLLALSELYWLGMTGFLDTVSIPANRNPSNSPVAGETDVN